MFAQVQRVAVSATECTRTFARVATAVGSHARRVKEIFGQKPSEIAKVQSLIVSVAAAAPCETETVAAPSGDKHLKHFIFMI